MAKAVTPPAQNPTSYAAEGVQVATDACELVSSLRSEVSALERHRTALEVEVERLEDASAATIDGTAAAAAWIAAAEQNGKKLPTGTTRSAQAVAVDRDGVAVTKEETEPTVGLHAQREMRVPRTGRRARAAVVLLRALQGDERLSTSMPAPLATALSKASGTAEAELAILAAAAERRRDSRQRARDAIMLKSVEDTTR